MIQLSASCETVTAEGHCLTVCCCGLSAGCSGDSGRLRRRVVAAAGESLA